jgi:hypothetical protein
MPSLRNRSTQSYLLLFTTIVIISAILLQYENNSSTQEQPSTFTIELQPTKPNEMTRQQRLEDYEYFYSFIETNYPYIALKQRTLGTNWLERRQATTKRIEECTTNREFLEIMIDEVQALQNRHTEVMDPNEVQTYQATYQDVHPMNKIFTEQVVEAYRYWQPYFYDYYYIRNMRYNVEIIYSRGEYIVTDRQGHATTQYGANPTVTKINNIPVHQAIRNASSYMDYDYVREQPYVWAITPNTFIDAVFTLTYDNGTEIDQVFPTVFGTPRTNFYPAPDLITRKYTNHSTGYIYIKTFDPETIGQLKPTILDFLKETENYEYLIIDIRGNTGGSYQSWLDAIVKPLISEDTLHEYYLAYRNNPYILSFHEGWLNERAPVPKEHFKELPPEAKTQDYIIYNFSTTYTPTRQISFNGQIILLTDRTVYSAAEGFTNFCKQTGFATIIGTTSGGDGFFVWPVYVVLPHSKLVITMTSSMSLDSRGRANEETRTIPDIIKETLITDHTQLIEYTLGLIEQGKLASNR